MFTEVVLPETSSLVIYDEATPDAEIVGFVLKYAHSSFIGRNHCSTGKRKSGPV